MIGRFPLGSRNGHLHDTYPQEWELLLWRSMFSGHCSESISRKLQNQTGCLSFPTDVGIQTFSTTPFSEMVRQALGHILVLRFDAKDAIITQPLILCPHAHYFVTLVFIGAYHLLNSLVLLEKIINLDYNSSRFSIF